TPAPVEPSVRTAVAPATIDIQTSCLTPVFNISSEDEGELLGDLGPRAGRRGHPQLAVGVPIGPRPARDSEAEALRAPHGRPEEDHRAALELHGHLADRVAVENEVTGDGRGSRGLLQVGPGEELVEDDLVVARERPGAAR